MTVLTLPFPISVNEQWKPVVGFVGAFEVSNLGNIRSVDRVVDHPTSGKLRLKGKPLKAHVNKSNHYLVVHLNFNKKIEFRTVHSIVAEAFLGPTPEGLNVLHRDGRRLNCASENLYHGTQLQNIKDSIAHGSFPIGTRAKGALLDEAKVIEIRRLAGKLSQRDIALKFSVSSGTIGALLRGKTWRHVV